MLTAAKSRIHLEDEKAAAAARVEQAARDTATALELAGVHVPGGKRKVGGSHSSAWSARQILRSAFTAVSSSAYPLPPQKKQNI